MADDTLSGICFDRPFIKAHVRSEDRFAMAQLVERHGGTEQDMVRCVVDTGLDALGWPEAKRIKAYADYRVRCVETGETNAYGRE